MSENNAVNVPDVVRTPVPSPEDAQPTPAITSSSVDSSTNDDGVPVEEEARLLEPTEFPEDDGPDLDQTPEDLGTDQTPEEDSA